MKTVSRRKTNYGVIVIVVLSISILFGFLFDIICTEIEKHIYPKPDEYAGFISKYSQEYGVSEDMVYAVIKTESGFDSSAVSSKGATGLMQIMPDTGTWIAEKLELENFTSEDLFDCEKNIMSNKVRTTLTYLKNKNLIENIGSDTKPKWSSK